MNLLRRILILLLAIVASAAHADWPQFRGTNSAGVGGSVPTEFGPGKNERWRAEVGQGHSSPCVAGDNLFLTAYDANTNSLEVVCLDSQKCAYGTLATRRIEVDRA